MVLLPPFTPKAIEALTPKARVICNQLIDAFIDKGGCDGAVDYAQHIPVRVIAHMLGVPETDGDLFRDWINAILNEGITDYSSADARPRGDDGLLPAAHGGRAARTPATTSSATWCSRPIRTARRSRTTTCWASVRLLLVAGIDTTWSGIGSCIWHLATHPEDRRRLVARPVADADGHRGIPARLRARDHGARGASRRPRSTAARSSRARW